MNEYSKEDIVRAVLTQLPQEWSECSTDALLSEWFTGRRSGNSYELSHSGYSAFAIASIEYRDFIFQPLEHQTPQQQRREMSQKFRFPYYLYDKMTHDKKFMIRVYDTRIANWIDLMGGISEYLASIDGYLPRT